MNSESLPIDIINLIVPYLGHEITTILDKSWRLKYMKKYGLTINTAKLQGSELVAMMVFIEKYPDARIKINSRSGQEYLITDNEIWSKIRNRVSELNIPLIINLNRIIALYPNVQKITAKIFHVDENLKLVETDSTGKYKDVTFVTFGKNVTNVTNVTFVTFGKKEMDRIAHGWNK